MPSFMTGKSESEWSEDEKKLAQDYDRKVKDLEEEREKYRKVYNITVPMHNLFCLFFQKTNLFILAN